MADGNKKVSMAVKKNQVTDLLTKCKELEINLKNWLAKPAPTLLVDAAVATVIKGGGGAALALVLDTIALRICSAFHVPLPPEAGPGLRLIKAHHGAVLMGAYAGITRVMKKKRGKDDVQTRVVAGFGSMVLYIIASGVICALLDVALFKMKEKYYEA